jgi:hypothetical protein
MIDIAARLRERLKLEYAVSTGDQAVPVFLIRDVLAKIECLQAPGRNAPRLAAPGIRSARAKNPTNVTGRTDGHG